MEHRCTHVRVAVRARPLVARERLDGAKACITVQEPSSCVMLGAKRTYQFDHAFGPASSQQQVYDACVSPLVDAFIKGYNTTVFALGATGSGKTHTLGSGTLLAGMPAQHGITPRAIRQLFNTLQERSSADSSFSVRMQFLEVLNDEVRDLLASPGSVQQHQQHQQQQQQQWIQSGNRDAPSSKSSIAIRETSDGRIIVTGARAEFASTKEELLQLLERGALARATGPTAMNEQSSRSHAILSLILEQRIPRCAQQQQQQQKQQQQQQQQQQPPAQVDATNTGSNTSSNDVVQVAGAAAGVHVISSKLNIVDLAGSERVVKRSSGLAGAAAGARLKETATINQGLLALSNVISALSEAAPDGCRRRHVPYRASKLTRLLQDSLGGTALTLMIACVSSADSALQDSLGTLKYAARARCIRNRPVVNSQRPGAAAAGGARSLAAEIQALQLQLLRRLVRQQLLQPAAALPPGLLPQLLLVDAASGGSSTAGQLLLRELQTMAACDAEALLLCDKPGGGDRTETKQVDQQTQQQQPVAEQPRAEQQQLLEETLQGAGLAAAQSAAAVHINSDQPQQDLLEAAELREFILQEMAAAQEQQHIATTLREEEAGVAPVAAAAAVQQEHGQKQCFLLHSSERGGGEAAAANGCAAGRSKASVSDEPQSSKAAAAAAAAAAAREASPEAPPPASSSCRDDAIKAVSAAGADTASPPAEAVSPPAGDSLLWRLNDDECEVLYDEEAVPFAAYAEYAHLTASPFKEDALLLAELQVVLADKAALQEEKEAAQAEAAAAQQAFERSRALLEAQLLQLTAAISTQEGLISTLQANAAEAKQMGETYMERCRELEAELAECNLDLQELTSALARVEADAAASEEEKAQLRQQYEGRIQAVLAQMGSLQRQLKSQDGSRLERERQRAALRVQQLQGELAAMRSHQDGLRQRLQERLVTQERAAAAKAREATALRRAAEAARRRVAELEQENKQQRLAMKAQAEQAALAQRQLKEVAAAAAANSGSSPQSASARRGGSGTQGRSPGAHNSNSSSSSGRTPGISNSGSSGGVMAASNTSPSKKHAAPAGSRTVPLLIAGLKPQPSEPPAAKAEAAASGQQQHKQDVVGSEIADGSWLQHQLQLLAANHTAGLQLQKLLCRRQDQVQQRAALLSVRQQLDERYAAARRGTGCSDAAACSSDVADKAAALSCEERHELLQELEDRLDDSEAELELLQQQLQQQAAVAAATAAAADDFAAQVARLSGGELSLLVQQAFQLLVEGDSHYRAAKHQAARLELEASEQQQQLEAAVCCLQQAQLQHQQQLAELQQGHEQQIMQLLRQQQQHEARRAAEAQQQQQQQQQQMSVSSSQRGWRDAGVILATRASLSSGLKGLSPSSHRSSSRGRAARDETAAAAAAAAAGRCLSENTEKQQCEQEQKGVKLLQRSEPEHQQCQTQPQNLQPQKLLGTRRKAQPQPTEQPASAKATGSPAQHQRDAKPSRDCMEGPVAAAGAPAQPDELEESLPPVTVGPGVVDGVAAGTPWLAAACHADDESPCVGSIDFARRRQQASAAAAAGVRSSGSGSAGTSPLSLTASASKLKEALAMYRNSSSSSSSNLAPPIMAAQSQQGASSQLQQRGVDASLLSLMSAAKTHRHSSSGGNTTTSSTGSGTKQKQQQLLQDFGSRCSSASSSTSSSSGLGSALASQQQQLGADASKSVVAGGRCAEDQGTRTSKSAYLESLRKQSIRVGTSDVRHHDSNE